MAYPTNDKTGAQNLVDLVLALRTSIGQRGSLSTTDKASVVAAINEVVQNLSDLSDTVANKTEINDSATAATNVWSALKTSNSISQACANLKADLLGGASAEWDTFQELVTKITSNADALEVLQAASAGRVSYKEEQDLTDLEKAQALINIGAASAGALASVKEDAEDAVLRVGVLEKKRENDYDLIMSNLQQIDDLYGQVTAVDGRVSNLETFKANVGNTNIDLVSIYENGVPSS